MELRTYKVAGLATYLDRTGDVKRILVNLTVEAPDAETAKVLMLAEIDIRKGATADYDPEARWAEPWNVQVEDETAKQEAITACGFTIGARVLHKSGGSDKRGADARVGVVKGVYTVTLRGKLAVRAAVDWPAPNRINGDGWHRSDVLTSGLVAATDEEIARRRSLNRQVNERNQARWEAERLARAVK